MPGKYEVMGSFTRHHVIKKRRGTEVNYDSPSLPLRMQHGGCVENTMMDGKHKAEFHYRGKMAGKQMAESDCRGSGTK